MATKKVGTLIDQLYKLNLKKEEAKKELKKHEEGISKIEKKYAEKEKEIFDTFKKEDIEGAMGRLATVSINKTVVASVKDWNKLYAYVKKTGGFDLLQRRVSNTAYRARLEDGKKVPGVDKFISVKLSLKKKR